MRALLTLSLTLAVSGQTFYSTHPRENNCNPGLLASYDLEVIRKPTNETNFICPNVEDNCCTTDSQLIIFKNWIQGNEKARILHVYKTFIATFSILFDDFKLVEQMADLVLQTKPADQITNCGEMATTIRNLKVSGMKDQVVTLAKRAFRLLYDARRGFYCSLCDADSHANYNTLDGAIHMSYGFCSSLVKETIGWVTFRNEFFPKIARLYGHFMSTCTTNGKYDNDDVLKDELKFFTDKTIKHHTSQCIENINEASAVGLCYDYCNHFNPAKFSRTFEREFTKLLGFRVWLNKQVVTKIFSSLNGPSKDDLSFTGRLLQANNTASSANSTNGTNGTNSTNTTKKPTTMTWGQQNFRSDYSSINEFNKKYRAQIIEPITFSASEDFRPTRIFNYKSSLFKLGKDKIYNIADMRTILSTSGINFLTYGYMMKMTNETLAKLDAQLDKEADAQYANYTDVFSVNYGYRNSSIQIIN